MEASKQNIALSACSWLPLEELRDRSILITGATGLVGYNLIQELSKLSSTYHIKLLALVRNEAKAKSILKDFLHCTSLVIGDVQNPIETEEPIDYIIHGASITSSRTFVEQPVDTIMTSVMGTGNLLELARRKNVRSMVYLSSMEVYGSPEDDRMLSEQDVGYLDPLSMRSSYPQSKRLCESLCVAYASQYGVPVKIARLAQTFGPGLQATDKRAIVQFMDSALHDQDIQIKASGESARMYLYTFDAVSALLTLLLNGENGRAYNIANKDTYCSIAQLAQKITELFQSSGRVLVNTGTAQERAIYPPDSFLRLDTSGLEALGWQPFFSLEQSLFGLHAHFQTN